MIALLAILLAVCALPAIAKQDQGTDRTPPRLSFIEGQASFWRTGAEDWVPARVNTPLAVGDSLYTGNNSNLELQIGSRAFVRAGSNTQLILVNHEPDFLQFQATTGQVSLDIRTLTAGHTIELDTPNAVFTIERTGYYRLEIADNATHFTTRRGGRAIVTPAGGTAQNIAPSEEVIVSGTTTPSVETYVAPELDTWDRWNYARTDHYAEAVSSRYLPSDIYGAEDLDHYGNWRVVPPYGSVWVPDGVAPGWTPYSTGSWVWDSYYGWTWIDIAPWGWAPFHYGRWVFINGYWAWAPGPVVVRTAYAPALVAFFGIGHGVSVRIGIGLPGIGWVALGWGEPLVPWWGPVGFAGRPWWGGWGGPRIVNNVVVHRTTVVNVTNITYQNSKIANAIVAVPHDHFGKRPIHESRLAAQGNLSPIIGTHPAKPTPASLAAGSGPTVRPPESVISRTVVTTRPPREVRVPWRTEGQKIRPSAPAMEPRIVPAPKRQTPAASSSPPFGDDGGAERARPPFPPRLEEMRPATPSPRITEEPSRVERAPTRPAPFEATPQGPRIQAPQGTRERLEPRREESAPPVQRENRYRSETRQIERPQHEPQSLPGKPASRMSPKRLPENMERGR